MKRIFAVFALLAVLCTCGCSNQEDARPEQEDTNQQTTENRDENDIAGREDAEDNDTLGEDIRDGAEDMGDAVKQGVDDAGNAVKKGADKIEDALDGDQTDGAETKPEK